MEESVDHPISPISSGTGTEFFSSNELRNAAGPTYIKVNAPGEPIAIVLYLFLAGFNKDARGAPDVPGTTHIPHVNDNDNFGGFFAMAWHPTEHELNDARAALALKINVAYNDIVILSYENAGRKARQTGGAVWFHEIRVFSVTDQRAMAKVTSFPFNGGTMIGNIVTREDAEMVAIDGSSARSTAGTSAVPRRGWWPSTLFRGRLAA